MPNAYEAVQATVGKMVTKVDMKAGDALFFDGTMLHGTESNLSDDVRIAAVIKLIPLGAPKVTAYYDESSPVGQQLSLYRHSDEFFIPKAFKSADPPDDSVFLGYIPSMPRRFTDSDLYSMIDGAQSNLGTTYP